VPFNSAAFAGQGSWQFEVHFQDNYRRDQAHFYGDEGLDGLDRILAKMDTHFGRVLQPNEWFVTSQTGGNVPIVRSDVVRMREDYIAIWGEESADRPNVYPPPI
jgi:hypothetical protein